jgi:enoyl-CoA hydratase/carnithine racemase
MSGFQELLYAVDSGVATVVFDRPERLNAWTPTLERELREALCQASQDDMVRCIVLTGAGRAFCAGMDMDVLQRAPVQQAVAAPSDEDANQRYGHFWEIEKPLIAAINGPASGVGLCLALFCDLRYVAPNAKLSFPYARRGLAAEHGLAWLLPRLIGPMASADLLFTGRTFLGIEAEQLGLARTLPEEGFLSSVHQRARDIAQLCSPRSIRVMKRQLIEARYQTLGQATRAADAAVAACRNTEDFKEGVAHFLEKRAPRFTGH